MNANQAAEPRRGSTTQPRVARNALPWVGPQGSFNPERVESARSHQSYPAPTPSGLSSIFSRIPRVARSAQPWAERFNPFRIIAARGASLFLTLALCTIVQAGTSPTNIPPADFSKIKPSMFADD